ncbi:MAG TPA: hypothetical protein VGN80_11005 [Devosiaceae bacterium]|jgi:hypothetical protein|nr:hypothetical protein [Devosiaceae bacterium]
MPRLIIRFAALLFALTANLPAIAQAPGWQYYEDPELGFTIDLPLAQFELIEDDAGPEVMRLYERGGDAMIEVYGGENVEGLSAAGFADMLSRADRIAEVTYRTGGRSWFVLSGYYERLGFEAQELIFYAKFMFSPGLERFAAFEISYPADEKQRFDALVERLEASFRRPD